MTKKKGKNEGLHLHNMKRRDTMGREHIDNTQTYTHTKKKITRSLPHLHNMKCIIGHYEEWSVENEDPLQMASYFEHNRSGWTTEGGIPNLPDHHPLEGPRWKVKVWGKDDPERQWNKVNCLLCLSLKPLTLSLTQPYSHPVLQVWVGESTHSMPVFRTVVPMVRVILVSITVVLK